MRYVLLSIVFLAFLSLPLCAQDNYEIQVYASETVAPKTLMVELHSNFTVDGFKHLPGSAYTASNLYPQTMPRIRLSRSPRTSPPGPR